MPQNPTNITESPEFKEFCFFDHDERITRLEEENKKLREMIKVSL